MGRTKIIFATMVAVCSLELGAVAYAGEGIPMLPPQPLVSQTSTTVIGQSMPKFNAAMEPVVTAKFANKVIGQNGPHFVDQKQPSGASYAQIGLPQGVKSTAIVSLPQSKKPKA